MDRLAPAILLMTRFGLAGMVNTLVGFAVIATLDVGLGVPPAIANAAGYLAGFAVSYGLNRNFVFQSTERPRATGPRFIVAIALAFAANQLVLAISSRLLAGGEAARIAAQLAAMATYTIVLFAACQLWVFRQSAAPDRAGAS